MPAGVDEKTWGRAKAQAKQQGQGSNYAYIMSIYKSMKKGDSRKKTMKSYGVGKTTNVPDSYFDKDELRAGIEIEKEHTDDPKIAKEIAKDHIIEGKLKKRGKYDNDYYLHLKRMEKEHIEG